MSNRFYSLQKGIQEKKQYLVCLGTGKLYTSHIETVCDSITAERLSKEHAVYTTANSVLENIAVQLFPQNWQKMSKG